MRAKRLVSPVVAARVAAVSLAALGVITAPSSARADEPDASQVLALRDLFNAGKDLEKDGDYSGALEKFKQVGAIKMTPQVRFHIALCHEKLGQFTRALNGFEKAAEEARLAGKSGEDVARMAPLRVEALRKRVGVVVVDVTGTVRKSRVLIDDTVVAQALFGTKIPLDPGAHQVVIERPDGSRDAREITVTEGSFETVTLEVNDPIEADPAPVVAQPKPDGTPAPRPKSPRPKAQSPVPAYVALATGGASLVAAGVFFGLRTAAIADVRATCREGDAGCDPALRARADEGRTFSTLSLVLAGFGVASLATGGVLLVALGPKAPPAEAAPAEAASRRPAPRLALVAGPASLRLAGRF